MFFGRLSKVERLQNRFKMLEISSKALFERVGKIESKVKHSEKNSARAENQIREAQTARKELVTRIMKLEARKERKKERRLN